MANTLARPYALSSALRTPLLRCFASVSLAKPFFSRTISEKVRVLCHRELQIRGLWCSRSRYQGYLAQSFSIRATQVSESGSIDPPMIQSMEKKIKEHLNAEEVTVKDAYGDGRHVSIDVISSAFEGESAVNRQRMVYKAISEELQSTVHAVDQMSTRTPSEAASQQ